MGTKLYVGNLPFSTTEPDLQDLFAGAGTVSEVMLVQDKFTGKSRGFAFVTMSSDSEAQAAIEQFHGTAADTAVVAAVADAGTSAAVAAKTAADAAAGVSAATKVF